MLAHLSALFGWSAVVGWGLSAYPTIISNHQLKSVQGITMEYLFFNMMGFILYTLYTSLMWGSPLVREEFFLVHGQYPLIKLNDVFFGVHNLLTNSVLMFQAYCCGFRKNDNQVLSFTAKVIISMVACYLIGGSIYIYQTQGFEPNIKSFNWMHLFTSLGVVKVLMSVFKNIPQIIYNYNRKSTHGWPIVMIWFDFFGASLSLGQLIIDAYTVHDLSAIWDNKPKFFLAIQVILADTIFFFQHYYLYWNADISIYGPFPKLTSYDSIIQEDEEFLAEHAHDHDHPNNSICEVSPTDKDELQRLTV